MWIVMTASAKMPSTCWGRYRRVAIVRVLSYDYNRGRGPTQINRNHKACLQVIDMGRHHVGSTERSAYARTLKLANERCRELNNAEPIATVDLLWTWGGSA